MNKLRARGIIEKVKNKAFYRVTPLGWKWMWLEIASHTYFKNPMISKSYKKDLLANSEQPNKIEDAYEAINQGLTTITQELALCL
jgi:predicted transcriptional regulator